MNKHSRSFVSWNIAIEKPWTSAHTASAINSGRYNNQAAHNVAKWAKCPQVQIKVSILDPFHLISISHVRFLLKLEYNINGSHDEEAMWLFHFI